MRAGRFYTERGPREEMSHLVGVKVYQEYLWTFAGKRYLAIHGHQFDRFLVDNAALRAIGEFLHIQIQRFDSERNILTRFLDRQNSKWLRLSPKVACGAMAQARMRGADVVFCGHTHLAMQAEKDGVRYYNSGCWTGDDPTFITVDDAGVEIHYYSVKQPQADQAEPVRELASATDRAEELPADTGPDIFCHSR